MRPDFLVRISPSRRWYGALMAPPNPLDIAAQGVRTLRAFGQRIPNAGGVLAPSLESAVSGRTVLITGASSGIGKSTALKIGEAGGTVLRVARTEEKLEAVAPVVSCPRR